MKGQMLFGGLLAVVLLSVSAYGGVATLDFNADGVFPHQEAAASYPGSTVGRYLDGRVQDTVAGGLWKQVANASNDGYVGYYGNVPELATTDTSSPLSINVNLRLLQSVPKSGEFYLNMRSAAGAIWMYFQYDATTGASAIGGRHSNGSIFVRSLPAGKTLGEFHDLTMIWDPTVSDSMPAKLYVDNEHIGDTYAGVNYGTSTGGYVEFGDFLNGSQNSMWETDWLRFGNDLAVVPEPMTITLLSVGFLGGLRLRRRHR